MDEREIRSKARALSMSFAKVSGVILKGVESQPALAETVRSEFQKFGLRIYEDTLIVPAYFSEFSEDRLASFLESRGEKNAVIEVNPGISGFEAMWKALEPLRKRGYRFSDFDRFARRMNTGIKKDSAESREQKTEK
jgi:hypothetical protein